VSNASSCRLRIRLLAAVASFAAFTLALTPALAEAQAPGSLAQLASPNSCIQWPQASTGCPANGGGLNDTSDVAMSPDGKSVYVLGYNDAAIAEFQRNADGSLTQPGGTSACIADTGAPFNGSCSNTTAIGLVRPLAIVVSPDGRNVYVAAMDDSGDGVISEFARDPTDGSLTQLSGANACIAENAETSGPGSPCNQVAWGIVEPTGLAISPDGKYVYALDQDAEDIAVFTRAADGSLSEPGAQDDCTEDSTEESTQCDSTAIGLGRVDAVTISPDGNNLYTGSAQSPGTIAEFARGDDGSLTQLAGANDCIQEQDDASACGTETGEGIAEVASLAVSPDGQNLYATSSGTDGTLAEFTRSADGSLTQLGNGNNCIEEHDSDAGCDQEGNGLDGADDVVASPDGADVYVATSQGDCCGQAIAEFARSSADGSLTQLTSPDNCIEDTGGDDCDNETGTGLGGGDLVVSPDGLSLYATGGDDIAELARTPVDYALAVTLAGSGTGGVSDGTGALACPPTCSHAYTANSEVTLTATPASGSTFTGWSGACSGTGACEIAMSTPMNVTATFAPIPEAPAPVLTSAPTAVTDAGAGFDGSVDPEGLPTTVYFQYGLDERYSQVGASGANYTGQTPSQQIGSDFTDHTVGPVSVAGLVPNALYHVRLVATNSAGTTFGQDVTFTTALAPAPSAPIPGQTFNIAPVSGLVQIYIHGQLVPLTQLQQIHSGIPVDTLHGTLKLTISVSSSGGPEGDAATARTRMKTQTGEFGGAVFRLHQATSGPNRGLTTVMMVESAFKGAPSQSICKATGTASDAHAAKVSSKVIQLLHASAHGKFATSGRYSAATVRGTIWEMIARCDGTLVHAIKDEVVVTNFVRHTTIVLHAGQSYLAPGPS
jgi:6-phosphogluconolactonase (cycloisomerase 2 family)